MTWLRCRSLGRDKLPPHRWKVPAGPGPVEPLCIHSRYSFGTIKTYANGQLCEQQPEETGLRLLPGYFAHYKIGCSRWLSVTAKKPDSVLAGYLDHFEMHNVLRNESEVRDMYLAIPS